MTFAEIINSGMPITEIVNYLVGLIPGVAAVSINGILILVAAAVVSVILANYGRKLLNLLKILVCAGAGYWVGSTIVWQYVGSFLEQYDVTSVIAGIALAVVCVILGQFAYTLVFAGALGYAAWYLIDAGILRITAVNPDDSMTVIGIAIGFGVAALIFRGLFETVLTSVIGGAGFSFGLYTAVVNLTALYNLGKNGTGIRFTSELVLGVPFETVMLVIIGIIVCLLGYVKQVKNRHRY